MWVLFSYVYKAYFSKILASGGLRRKQVSHEEWLCVPFSYVYKVYFSNFFRLWWFKNKASCTLAMTLTLSGILICLQSLFFKNFRLRRFGEETSCTLRITMSAILISRLWWFKNKASYTLAMTLTLSVIFICLQGLFFKKISPPAV